MSEWEGNRILHHRVSRAMLVGPDGKHHEPTGDRRVDRGESDDCQRDAGARLCDPVDIAPVQDVTNETPPPGYWRPIRLHRVGHCFFSGCATEPVTLAPSAAASMALIMAPIGSLASGMT